jgi:predicted Zn-dependent protease
MMATNRPLDEKVARAAVDAVFGAVKEQDVSVNLEATERGFLRYAVNEATQSGVVSDVAASVTVAIGTRHASVTVHGLQPALVAEAARRARALAELAPEDPEYMPSPAAASMRTVPAAWSDTTARLTPDDRAALVADCIGEAKKQQLIAAGFVDHVRRTTVVATRAGFFGLHSGTHIDMTTTARTPDGSGSGWAQTTGVKPEDVDGRAATRVACDKALRARGAKPLEPGRYPVVLEPAAVAELLMYLSFDLDARGADEGRNCFAKKGGGSKVGQNVLGALTLRSDPWSLLAPSAPFDSEGLPRAPITWAKDGVLERLQTSRYWAKKTGTTYEAVPGQIIASGPNPQPLEQLIAGLDRGLVVTRFWYVRMLEPQTLTLTGLTRDGVFLVEKGKVVGPVNNFRFNQSVTQLFVDTDGYGVTTPTLGDGPFRLAVPAIRAKAFHMASKSDAV